MKRLGTVNEQGFIMVWSLLLLIVVTLLGVSSISTSIFEDKMAANEALHKQAFYEADGGTEVGLAALKHNINCISGFGGRNIDGIIYIEDNDDNSATSLNFWLENSNINGITMASDSDRDFYYPVGYLPGDPHSNGKINGRVFAMAGGSFVQLAGYEDLAKNIADGGAYLTYDFKVEHVGTRNSRSGICLSYRVDSQFASNPSGNCVY